jgi:hypothetical protein
MNRRTLAGRVRLAVPDPGSLHGHQHGRKRCRPVYCRRNRAFLPKSNLAKAWSYRLTAQAGTPSLGAEGRQAPSSAQSSSLLARRSSALLRQQTDRSSFHLWRFYAYALGDTGALACERCDELHLHGYWSDSWGDRVLRLRTRYLPYRSKMSFGDVGQRLVGCSAKTELPNCRRRSRVLAHGYSRWAQ